MKNYSKNNFSNSDRKKQVKKSDFRKFSKSRQFGDENNSGKKGLKNKDLKFSNSVKKKTIKLLEKSKFYEYFSCKNGQPMGAKNFSWSASLYLDLKISPN